MKLKILLILAIFAALVLVAAPAQASTGSFVCVASPGSGPVGTVFGISCSGFTPGRISNIYAVEPDGRASGLNIYDFFPTSVKASSTGVVAFSFMTEEPGFFSVPPGKYIFVVQELVPDGGGAVNIRAQVPVTVESRADPLLGAVMASSFAGVTKDPISNGPEQWFNIAGTGFVPGEAVNIWVTQPPAATCSGLGIDQLTLGVLAGNGSSVWEAPGTVKADSSGTIAFQIGFRPSACMGTYIISAHALGSGIGGEIGVQLHDTPIPETNAVVVVSPSSVPAFNSVHTVSGTGFPANTGVSCWYTRPDGRVLFFIGFSAHADASGSFSVKNILDDFPPFTSTEPGMWSVTCANSSHSSIGTTKFLVFGLMADP